MRNTKTAASFSSKIPQLTALVLAAIFLAGCSLAGDITPPPDAELVPAQTPVRVQETAAAEPTTQPESEAAVAEAEAPAASAGEGLAHVSGNVRNQTTGAPVPAGIQVILHVFDGFELVQTLTMSSDANGAYAFDDVPVLPGQSVIMTVDYDSATYMSQLVHMSEDETEYQADIDVFDSTTDLGVLEVEQMHVIVQDAANSVQITELIVFANRSDHTLVAPSASGATFEVALPADATNLQIDDSFQASVETTASGFAIAAPIYPTTEPYQLVFSYLLPYEGELVFEQLVNYPVAATSILLPEGAIEVSGPGITKLGPRELPSELTVVVYQGSALAPGDLFRFELRGYSEAETLTSRLAGGDSSNLLLGAGALVLALAGLGWWWFQREPAPGAGDRSSVHPTKVLAPDQAVARRDALLQEIAALDDKFDASKIAQGEYRRQRQALKRELVELIALYDLDV